MKALVTGGNGFIGSWVCRELLKNNIKVRVLLKKGSSKENLKDLDIDYFEGNITNPEDVHRATTGCEVIFHLAALHAHWLSDFKTMYDINVTGTKNILKAAEDNKIKKFIHTSTQNIIAYKKNSISTEEDIVETLKGQSHYTKSKYLAEMEVFKAVERGLNCVILNISGPFGSGDKKPGPTGTIITNFLKEKYPFYINAWFSTVDVEDVARAQLSAYKYGISGERYIISNRDISLKEFYSILEKISGIKKPAIRLPKWLAYSLAFVLEFVSNHFTHRASMLTVDRVKQKSKRKRISNQKAMDKLKLNFTPIEESLKKSVEYFLKKGL